MSDENLDLLGTEALKIYRKETKRSFTTTKSRSFHEESWDETVEDERTILDFAKWYASQRDEVLNQAINERNYYKARYEKLSGWCNEMRGKLRWLKNISFDDEKGL